jgi:hypothetical protein
MSVCLLRRVASIAAVIALIFGMGFAPARAVPMPEMGKTGHCADCPDRAPVAPVKGMPCAALTCLGSVTIGPMAQAEVRQPIVTAVGYWLIPLHNLIGRAIRPDPLPPRSPSSSSNR